MKKAVLLALFCCFLLPTTTQAQPNLNLTQFVNDLKQGNISVSSAASQIASSTNFNLTDATTFAENLQGMLDPQVAGELLGNVLTGQISEALGTELSEMINLGEFTSLSNIQQLLNMPNISEQLQEMIQGMVLEEITEMMTNLTELIGGPEALQQLANELGAEAIAEILENIAPELVEALGGEEAIADALNQAAGGDGVSSPSGSPPAGDDSSHRCCQCQKPITTNHINIRNHMTSEFEAYRFWFVNDMFKQNVLPAWQLMTNQLTSVGMTQVSTIGKFFDSKHQLETQRIFQTLTAEAHKDYHPSEGLCEFGTTIRSLAASERKSDMAQRALANRTMQRQLGNGDGVSRLGSFSDKESRIKNFIKDYCDPTDNGNGFNRFCQGTASSKERQNKDVNFTQTIENQLTLDLDFSDSNITPDEQDIMALSANLFAHNVLPTSADRVLANGENSPLQAASIYLTLRSIAAKRSVAQNSFNAVAGLKANGDTGSTPYLYRLMQDLGVKKAELEDLLGEKPSYFAQMEVLTKNIYQNPNFYTDLYDKPANVERKGAVLQAIGLMQDRDTFDSLLRSEAALATLLETLLQREHSKVSARISDIEGDGEDF